MKTIILASLLALSFSSFASDAQVDTASSVITPTEVDCGSNAVSQPVYTWSKQLRKFVFVGWTCVDLGRDHAGSDRD